MLEFGIIGIGYAWVFSYGLGSLAVGIKREGWIKEKMVIYINNMV